MCVFLFLSDETAFRFWQQQRFTIIRVFLDRLKVCGWTIYALRAFCNVSLGHGQYITTTRAEGYVEKPKPFRYQSWLRNCYVVKQYTIWKSIRFTNSTTFFYRTRCALSTALTDDVITDSFIVIAGTIGTEESNKSFTDDGRDFNPQTKKT